MKVIPGLVCAFLLVSAVQAQIGGLQCEVPLNAARLLELFQQSPSEACRNQILTIVNVEDYVAEAATVFQALATICEPVCLEYARMLALECVPSYVDTLGLACGKNEQAAFCYQNVIQNNGTLLLAQCFPNATDEMVINATAEVTDSPPTQLPFMCSDVCQSALEDFRAFHGCCVNNAFNTSAFGLESYGIASYGLWRACQVETVTGNCSSPFVDDDTPPPGTDSAYVLAAHGMLSLLAVLMAFLVMI